MLQQFVKNFAFLQLILISSLQTLLNYLYFVILHKIIFHFKGLYSLFISRFCCLHCHYRKVLYTLYKYFFTYIYNSCVYFWLKQSTVVHEWCLGFNKPDFDIFFTIFILTSCMYQWKHFALTKVLERILVLSKCFFKF